jgi:hypothetical protein
VLLFLPAVAWKASQFPGPIVITRLHLFVAYNGDNLRIGEHYRISNLGEKTYQGVDDPQSGERVTIPFTLPDGAEALRFEESSLGERFVAVEDGFVDTRPVPPGVDTVEVFVTYELPYQAGGMVARVFDLPVEAVVLVIAEEGLVLEGEGLAFAETFDTEVGSALSYTAGPLKAGEPLVFSVVPGSPPVPATAVARDAVAETIVGMAALAVALGLGYLLWRVPALPEQCPAQVRSLVAGVVALDASFESGELGETRYRREREALKAQICTLLTSAG